MLGFGFRFLCCFSLSRLDHYSENRKFTELGKKKNNAETWSMFDFFPSGKAMFTLPTLFPDQLLIVLAKSVPTATKNMILQIIIW